MSGDVRRLSCQVSATRGDGGRPLATVRNCLLSSRPQVRFLLGARFSAAGQRLSGRSFPGPSTMSFPPLLAVMADRACYVRPVSTGASGMRPHSAHDPS